MGGLIASESQSLIHQVIYSVKYNMFSTSTCGSEGLNPLFIRSSIPLQQDP